MKLSTGLRNGLLVTGSLESLMASGKIKIYSGTVPATADDALGSATLLCTIDRSGSGINLDTTATNGTILKLGSETWSGVNAASGTGTFFRHATASDTGVSSTTEVRIQGTFGIAGCDMNRTAGATLTSAATTTIDYYAVVLPTL